jgi:para-nitrobenzyl esterase
MRSRRCVPLSALLVVLAAWVPAAAAADVVVTTETGQVRGFTADGLREFRGIPFAVPPLGERRFESPAPAAPWSGVLDATRHRSPCPQVVRYGQTDASDDEDCLYLNVAAPDDRAKPTDRLRPVLVWVHGGAYVGGSADIYPMRRYALRGDLVMVSINYRLGVFGFLAHPALDVRHAATLGLEDQREALRWIHRNIRAFGGDPEQVTLAGESAGAASVCLQLMAPAEATGLFQRAVVQSVGCTVRLRSMADANATALRIAAAVHCDDLATAAACLRARSVAELLRAQVEIGETEARAFAPAVGTVSTPQQGRDAFAAGQFVRVPMLNGGNRDEMRLYVGYDVAAGRAVDPRTIGDRLKAVYGEHAGQVAAEYAAAKGTSLPAWLGRLESDFVPGGPLSNCLMLQTARLAARYVPVFEYEFTDADAPPVMADPGFPMGAVHSAELAYFFPHISYNQRIDGPDVPAGSRALSDRMIDYWSAFAHAGRPSVRGLPTWPRYRAAGDVMRLDPASSGPFDAPAAHHCGFWQSLYPELLR